VYVSVDALVGDQLEGWVGPECAEGRLNEFYWKLEACKRHLAWRRGMELVRVGGS
jgi:hypothetical protein